MTGNTAIAWTEKTWNPVVGCSIVSAGCTNCYAMKMAGRLEAMAEADERKYAAPSPLHHYLGTTQPSNAGAVWTGKIAEAPERILTAPLRWQKPAMIFVNSMGDLFHESVPDATIDKVFAVMALTPRHTYQILTKREKRMQAYMADKFRPQKLARAMVDLFLINAPRASIKLYGKLINAHWPVQSVGDVDMPDDIFVDPWPLPNVWLGVSIEDQKTADQRVPVLLDTPAAIRFVSAEPLLGEVDLRNLYFPKSCECIDEKPTLDAFNATVYCPGCCEGAESMDCGRLDWVIVGGESGPKARPMHPDWARSLRDQCQAAGVPFFFKQWGEWQPSNQGPNPHVVGRAKSVRILKHDGSVSDGAIARPEIGEHFVFSTGKKRAGDFLDGVQHHNWPKVAP